ncbi:uncharacterized protein LOC131164592 isoform X2 [Malania oleifera]|nr:uncharacterized protein LOC131164592 isoform X2 [Malania oleifera]XP_057977874.1 uncharacterized protein LOC131164592 isoform X2 [Malania oleifera]
MAKGCRGRRRIASRQHRPTPYPLSSCAQDVLDGIIPMKRSRALEKEDWEDALCSVCMEYPHNAVLLLCSSHDKGCRPYMCGTSCRYSNCLDQYKKAYTKVTADHHGHPLYSLSDHTVSSWPIETGEVTELACPLCRGQVKGWTVVEPAREYLNAKRRSCMQDDCSFVGTYKELRKHVKAEHPSARPHKIDPIVEQKWRNLEHERERDDVISMITSSMPGAMVFGDYVIDGIHYGFDTDEEEGFDADAADRNGGLEIGFDSNWVNVFLLLHAFGPVGNVGLNRWQGAVRIRHTSPVGGIDSSSQDNDNGSDEYIFGDNDGVASPLAHDAHNHRRRLRLDQVPRRNRLRDPNRGQ